MVLGVTDTMYYQVEAITLFIQSDPDLAIALLDHVPAGGGLEMMLDFIGKSWAESDLKAALAWANQQTDSEIKDAILKGISRIMTQEDPQGLFAYAQSLPPGVSQDRLIKDVWCTFYYAVFSSDDGVQGVLARMHALPEGRTKELAASGISQGMAGYDPKAALVLASGIGDSNLRTEAQERVVMNWFWKAPAAATQWIATQWINSSSLPQEVKTQMLAKAQLLPETPLPRPIIVPPSRSR